MPKLLAQSTPRRWFGDEDWTDYTLEVDVTLVEDVRHKCGGCINPRRYGRRQRHAILDPHRTNINANFPMERESVGPHRNASTR